MDPMMLMQMMSAMNGGSQNSGARSSIIGDTSQYNSGASIPYQQTQTQQTPYQQAIMKALMGGRM